MCTIVYSPPRKGKLPLMAMGVLRVSSSPQLSFFFLFHNIIIHYNGFAMRIIIHSDGQRLRLLGLASRALVLRTVPAVFLILAFPVLGLRFIFTSGSVCRRVLFQ